MVKLKEWVLKKYRKPHLIILKKREENFEETVKDIKRWQGIEAWWGMDPRLEEME